MKRLLAASAVALLALVPTGAARADVVHLVNGSTIEGTAIEMGSEVQVKLRFGAITLQRSEIASIERRPTSLEEYALRCAHANLADPATVTRLVEWCGENSLDVQAEQLREVGRGAELERRLEAVRAEDADALYGLAMWAAAEGYSAPVQRWLLERCVKADPDHARARRALGQAPYEGEWLSLEEIAAAKEADFERRMHDRGLVRVDGKWVPAKEADGLEAQRREIERLRRALDASLGKPDDGGGAGGRGTTIHPVVPVEPRGGARGSEPTALVPAR